MTFRKKLILAFSTLNVLFLTAAVCLILIKSTNTAILSVIILSSLFLSLSLIFISRLLKDISEPINKLSVAARIISEGAFPQKISITGTSEINSFTTLFNRMIEDIYEKELLLEAARKAVSKELEEKKTLIREVYHRVKNNMQTISSLLRLQISSASDPGLAEVIQEARNRIQSMSLVHEFLYQTDDLINIQFRDYIYRLTNELQNSFSNSTVKLNIEIENCSLKIDTIISLGLITNELVSNAYKYAFNGMNRGTIHISLSKIDKNYCYTIKDDGKGMESGVVIKDLKSLGLRLVHVLSEQISAELDIKSSWGTSFSFHFSD